MKRIFAVFLLALSVGAADVRYVLLDGSNVVNAGVCDPARFKPDPKYTFMTNTPSYVQKGWRYSGGRWLTTEGGELPAATVALAERADELTATIDDLNKALANWDALSAAQQKAVLKRLTRVILILLQQQRALLEVQQ